MRRFAKPLQFDIEERTHLHTLTQIGEPLPIFTSERLCLSKGAFTPDANDANKSCYSRKVGRLNILSLLAKFAPFAHEIHYTTDTNSHHGRGFCQAAPVSLQNVFLFL